MVPMATRPTWIKSITVSPSPRVSQNGKGPKASFQRLSYRAPSVYYNFPIPHFSWIFHPPRAHELFVYADRGFSLDDPLQAAR
jgi:hypothetical protein